MKKAGGKWWSLAAAGQSGPGGWKPHFGNHCFSESKCLPSIPPCFTTSPNPFLFLQKLHVWALVMKAWSSSPWQAEETGL